MKPFEHLKEKIRESAHLNSAMALLSWDQEVMMPPGGTNFRAETIATLSGMYHDMMVIGVADALKAVEDVENGVQVVWDCRVEIENEPKPALVAEWLTRLYR